MVNKKKQITEKTVLLTLRLLQIIICMMFLFPSWIKSHLKGIELSCIFGGFWMHINRQTWTWKNLDRHQHPSLYRKIWQPFFFFLFLQKTLKNGPKCKQPFAQSDSNMTWLMEKRRDCVTPIPVVAFKWRRSTNWLSFGLQCHASRAS